MESGLLTSQQLDELKKVDSPTVANIIELFGIRPQVEGYCDGRMKSIYPQFPPAVGYAVTATLRTGYAAIGGGAYGGFPQLIIDSQSIPAPRIAVFQDLDEPPKSATYGEVMVSALQKFDFVGLVTSGAARDIEQVQDLGFPCWASSIIVSHGYPRILAGNIPVNVAGLQVHPGDLIHADGNGIVSIPHSIAEGVIQLAGPFAKAESIAMDYVKDPNATPEGFKQAMGRMRAAIQELGLQAKELITKSE